jgi:hypothetical protein
LWLRSRGRFGGLGLVGFGAATLFLDGAQALFLLAAAGRLERGHARFLGLAQQAGLELLASLAGGRNRGGTLRRARFLDRRRGRRSGGCRSRGSVGHAGLADQLAALHLDHDLVGAAVAEGLLDLARFDRTLQPQRLTAQRRFVVGIAHTCTYALRSKFACARP